MFKTKYVGNTMDKVFRMARTEGAVILFLFRSEEVSCSSFLLLLLPFHTLNPIGMIQSMVPQNYKQLNYNKKELIKKPWASCISTGLEFPRDQLSQLMTWWHLLHQQDQLIRRFSLFHILEQHKCLTINCWDWME